MRRYRAKPNRWLRRHPPARGTRINDSCKPQYVLRSTWYRRPARSFKSRLTPLEIDQLYAEWTGRSMLDIHHIIADQKAIIWRQMKPLMDEFYSVQMGGKRRG